MRFWKKPATIGHGIRYGGDMRIAAAVFLLVHGVAHLVGFFGAGALPACLHGSIDGWQLTNGRRLPTRGRAVWILPSGPFAYGDFQFDPARIEFNVAP